MLQNVLETDLAEASGLLNPDLIFTTAGWLLLLGWLNLKDWLQHSVLAPRCQPVAVDAGIAV